MAYDLNLKGVTVFRDGCKEGVLASIPKKEPNTGSRSDCRVIIQDLLDVEQAERIRAYWKGKKLYINVSLTDEGQPIEVFAKLPIEAGINGEGVYNPALWQERTSNWDLACRLISLNLRAGIPLNTILKQLDRSTYSMVDAAGILKRVLQRYVPDSEEGDEGQQCPECKEMEYFYEGGCGICKACGFTTCG
jgi:ribonucleoside-diphosphate reductase alpha chain